MVGFFFNESFRRNFNIVLTFFIGFDYFQICILSAEVFEAIEKMKRANYFQDGDCKEIKKSFPCNVSPWSHSVFLTETVRTYHIPSQLQSSNAYDQERRTFCNPKKPLGE